MDIKDDEQIFLPKSRAQWRDWLIRNGTVERSVELVIMTKKSKSPGINYNQAVEEALCFGWIDSRAHKRDAESYLLHFTPRSPKSGWSKLNRERVAKMIMEGSMTPAGQRMIDLAIETGKWEPERSI
jgi:uncharacterized protein YdeI (YjbR/CyaY-like superfamily)